MVASVVAVGLCMVGVVIADTVATGAARWLLTVGLIVLLTLPLVVGSTLANRSQQDKTDRMVGTLTHQLAEAVDVAGQHARGQEVQARRHENQALRQENQALRQEFESRRANVLNMAGGEPEVIDVIERAFTATLPGSPDPEVIYARITAAPRGATGPEAVILAGTTPTSRYCAS